MVHTILHQRDRADYDRWRDHRIPSPHPPAAGPYDITLGPDGAMWFVERNVNKIGRITTTGSVTEFDIPTARSEPYAITSGNDGALWFVEKSRTANRIGRITVDGVISEFRIPIAGASLST